MKLVFSQCKLDLIIEFLFAGSTLFTTNLSEQKYVWLSLWVQSCLSEDERLWWKKKSLLLSSTFTKQKFVMSGILTVHRGVYNVRRKRKCHVSVFFNLENASFCSLQPVFQCDENLVLCPLREGQCLIKQTTSLSFLLF